jgi:phosphatidylinositol alpha-1,6-mannosyltransferase
MPGTKSRMTLEAAKPHCTSSRQTVAVADRPSTKAQRTRVLLLTDSFLPHAGGSRNYYYNLYKGLVERGESQVSVLTKKIPGWKKFDREACTDYFCIHRRFTPLTSLKYHELPKGFFPFAQAMWHVLRQSPAIIHAGDLYPQGVIAMALKQLYGLPYVVYCHGEEITQSDRFRYQPRVRGRIYKNADGVVAASEFARQNLLRIGIPEERIRKITPGVDVQKYSSGCSKEELSRSYGLDGKIVLLTVARLVPRKGHRLVLEALGGICRQNPNVHYAIVGTGPEASRLRQVVQEKNLGDKVTFFGHVSDAQLADFYNLCDVMVMPNRQEGNGDVEGFGMVFLEANAAGKPVIGGKTGGAAEAIAEGITGLLVDPDDPQDLARALCQLVSDRELRERLGRAGSTRARLEFDWATRAGALERINQEILLRSGGPAACENRSPFSRSSPTEKVARS